MRADEIDDLLGGGAGLENFGDSGALQCGNVFTGNDAAGNEQNIVDSLTAEQFADARKDGIMRAGEDGDANSVDVLLNGGAYNLFRRLPKAGIDYFHTGISQRARDNFGATVMAIKSGFGDKDAKGTIHRFSDE
jgi:hypothetical protein